MCKYCDYIPYTEYNDHNHIQCPFRKSMYCGFCASYGHPESDCPAPPSIESRTPQFIEQLLPPHLITSYNIHSATPLPKTFNPPTRYDVIEVINNYESIKRYLLSVIGGIPTKAKEDDLRRTLDDYARKNNKLIVFSPPPMD